MWFLRVASGPTIGSDMDFPDVFRNYGIMQDLCKNKVSINTSELFIVAQVVYTESDLTDYKCIHSVH